MAPVEKKKKSSGSDSGSDKKKSGGPKVSFNVSIGKKRRRRRNRINCNKMIKNLKSDDPAKRTKARI